MFTRWLTTNIYGIPGRVYSHSMMGWISKVESQIPNNRHFVIAYPIDQCITMIPNHS